MVFNFKNLKDLIVPEYLIITFFTTFAIFLIIENSFDSIYGLILIILSISFVSLGLNAFNQIYDLSGDKISKPNRPIVSNKISIKEAKFVSWSLYFFAILISFFVNLIFSGIIILSVLFAIAYSHPFIRLKKIPFSGIIFGVFFYSIIPFLSIWTLSFNYFPLHFFCFFIMLTFISSSLKDYEDIHADKKEKLINLFTIFGKKAYLLILNSWFIIIFCMFLFSWLFLDFKFFITGLISILFSGIFLILMKGKVVEKIIITQSRLLTYLMLSSIFIELLYGITAFYS